MPRTPIRLSVNIDHVATVRQARRGADPDIIAAARLALKGGAVGITVHLREDRRHIQDRDVYALTPVVPRLNFELATIDEIVAIACEVKPAEATLVPEKREELTTEGGLDVVAHETAVGAAIERLHRAGVHVALFIDPDERQIDASRRLGAQAVEIQTARYSEALGAEAIAKELADLRAAGRHASARGLHVHLGHGLNYSNTAAVLDVPGVEELNIGHSIVSRAVLVGMEPAVREMAEILNR